MAGHLLDAGHEMTVFDLRSEVVEDFAAKGAVPAGSPADVAAATELVFTSLPGPQDVEQVVFGPSGLAGGWREGSTYVDLSTNSPTVVRRIHARLLEQGVEMLDAPVSGGPSGAESRKLAIWAGGAEATFARMRPVLEGFADEPIYVGPIGAGSVAKLVHNCAGYVIQAGLAEVFTLGVKAGVDPLGLWQAVRKGALGRRRTFDSLADHFLPGDFDPAAFALRLAHKDVSLATALGREVGVPMRLGNLALEEMTEALNRGWGALDSRVAMVLQEERAGVNIAVPLEALRAALAEDSR